MTAGDAGRIERERDHWDHELPTVDEVVEAFHQPVDRNMQLMLDAVTPGPGRTVLDFACGGGLTSLLLARRGAAVTGVDLSPRSIDVARAAADRVGVNVNFVVADLEELELPEDGFDAMVGHWALHHLDIAVMAPKMARCVKPGATAAFVETIGVNPVLMLARKHLTGRFGVPRFGTLDEHPLVAADLRELRQAFGKLELRTEHYEFLRLFDRQVLRYRSSTASRVLGRIDDRLAHLPAVKDWGYHQVLIATRTV